MNHKNQFAHPKRLYVIAGVSLVVGWMAFNEFQKKYAPQVINQRILEELNKSQKRMKLLNEIMDNKTQKQHEDHEKSSKEFKTFFKETKADLNRDFELAEERRKRREQEFDEAFARSKKEAIQAMRKSSKEFDKVWEKDKK